MHEDLPRRIDESQAVCEESPINWIEDSQLSQSLNGQEKHHTDDEISDELENGEPTAAFSEQKTTYQRARSTRVQSTTRTDKQTSTNGTTLESQRLPCTRQTTSRPTDRNHLHVAPVKIALQRADGALSGVAIRGRDALGLRIGGLLLRVVVLRSHDGERERMKRRKKKATERGKQGGTAGRWTDDGPWAYPSYMEGLSPADTG